MTSITEAELTEVLTEAGRKHHHAFISTDGADPEWAKWYAGFIQAVVWDGFGEVPTQSLLIHLLVGADRAHRTEAPDDPWQPFYARFILGNL